MKVIVNWRQGSVVSRRDKLRDTGNFLGLAASHFVLFGEEYPEGLIYLEQADGAIEGTRVNSEERLFVLETSRKRGLKKIRDHFVTQGKTQKYDYDNTVQYFELEIRKLTEELLG